MDELRPWPDLLSLAAVSLPASSSDATARLLQNLDHFRANYAIVALTILLLGLILHPIALVAFLAVAAAWFFLYFSRRDEPLAVAGVPLGDGVVFSALGVITLVALIATGVWPNVVVSGLIGALGVCLHAVLRSTDDLVSGDRSPYGHLATDDDPQGTYSII